MSARKHTPKLIGILIITLIIGFFLLPVSYQKYFFPKIPAFLEKQKFHLGLDLQGGTQLDYKIDMRKVVQKDRQSIIEGVKEVINRRVNSLGVSEPVIYSSFVADEYHVIVELPGVKDIEEAKKKVGKIIQLEFKEEKTEIDPDEKDKILVNAEKTFSRVRNEPDKFAIIGQEEQQATPGKVFYVETTDSYFENDPNTIYKLPKEIIEFAEGKIYPELIEIKPDDREAIVNQHPGVAIYKILKKENAIRQISEPKEVTAKHILISYKGADRTTAERTEEEATKLTQEILQKIKNGENFDELAKKYSDDTSNKDQGGLLDSPVKDNEGRYVKEFEKGTIALQKEGQVSEAVKTPFGYHIIKAEKIKEAVSKSQTEPKVKIARILFSTRPDPWKETGLTGEHFEHADVLFNEAYQPYVSIRFNKEGAKLFQEITKRNINKQVAIFVGGDEISSPVVQQEIEGGNASITGNFDIKQAQELARDLNTGAIPAPIVLSGQINIGASLGQDALQKSLKAGFLGVIILAIFMIGYYRFAGLLSLIALFIYALILLFLIKIELPYAMALTISIVIFIIVVGKILKNDDSGWEKLISFLMACFVLFFVSFLFSSPLVQTLAGIAAIILSIGMAVDANVLIFERIKEELLLKKPIEIAIESGFERAWLSIRDSNFSTLITCAILIYFGSSVIQGFAFNLAAGVLVSMFSAITLTKIFLESSSGLKMLKNYQLFIGVKSDQKETKALNFISHKKKWFGFSGILFAISIISPIILGLNLGLDFTGGSVIEIKFEKATQIEEIKKLITETEKELNQDNISNKATSLIPIAKAQDSKKIKEKVSFGSPIITVTDENTYLIKLKDIDEVTHQSLIQNFKQKFGALEELKFTTIGPIIGDNLKKKAIYALIIAIIMIVVYIAFAFRKIPRHINPWRFGSSAIFALVHDVYITFGLFIILGFALGVEIDTLFVTALLTIIGYSVHDTIVVFDRIRENLKHQKQGDTFEIISNRALNQTVGRSINTSLATLLTIIPLLLFGPESTKYFILALIFGITIGTYSSIFIASPILVVWQERKKK